MKPTCIYCGSEGPFNDEHALPHLFGEFTGFPVLSNRICEKCNGETGKLENQLAYSGPEAVMRRILGIGGRKGHKTVDPFQRGSMGAPPIDLEIRDPATGLNWLGTTDPGEPTGESPIQLRGREVRQVVVVNEDGDSYPVRVPN